MLKDTKKAILEALKTEVVGSGSKTENPSTVKFAVKRSEAAKGGLNPPNPLHNCPKTSPTAAMTTSDFEQSATRLKAINLQWKAFNLFGFNLNFGATIYRPKFDAAIRGVALVCIAIAQPAGIVIVG